MSLLEDFAFARDLEIEAVPLHGGGHFVWIRDAEVPLVGGEGRIGILGVGGTIDEALDDYAKKISGGLIFVRGRRIEVPVWR